MDWRSRRIRVIACGGTKHEATTALLAGKARKTPEHALFAGKAQSQ